MIIWHNVVAVWSALGARRQPRTVRQPGVYGTPTMAGSRPARQVILHVKREEEQRLLRGGNCL
jgi:hypothetical protein